MAAAWPAASALRLLLTGGDARCAGLRRRGAPGFDLINVYGPTETASSPPPATSPRPADEPRLRAISRRSGAPIANTQVLRPGPAPAPGAGRRPRRAVRRRRRGGARLPGAPGADRGALRAPTPSGAPGARLYRTGDRVRWARPDGRPGVPGARWTSRSRSAASASSRARSRRRWPRTPRCARRSVVAARTAPGRRQAAGGLRRPATRRPAPDAGAELTPSGAARLRLPRSASRLHGARGLRRRWTRCR